MAGRSQGHPSSTRRKAVSAQLRYAAPAAFRRARGLALPDHFDVPDRTLWTPGYAAEARRSLLDTARTLAEALTVVRPFTDAVFQGIANGAWHPAGGNWA
jgi:hypothetical protein